MRKIVFLAAILATALWTQSGCKKTTETAPPVSTAQAIDFTNLRPAFESASPEVKNQLEQVIMDIRSSMYAPALKGLDKLAADSTLSDAQKKAVTSLSGQLKQKMDSAAPK